MGSSVTSIVASSIWVTLPVARSSLLVSAAAALAYEADQQVAVLVSQRMLGRKQWLGSK